MDIDYHFDTVYVLARWAKFGPESAKLIAANSQLVDDNFDTTPFSDEEEKRNANAGIEVRYSCQNIWGNITGKGNAEIWIPFHFLPGLEGEDDADRLVCKKKSEMAKLLSARLRETSLDEEGFAFRLGIGLHVLADTWAHQEFAGINNILNKVQNLIFASQGSLVQRVLNDLSDSSVLSLSRVMDKVMPLGHAAAVHCPDIPYLWWKSGERFINGRKNWDEFMEASEEIFSILQEVSCEPVTGLSDAQKKLLYRCFKGIQEEDCEERHKSWLNRIHKNYFQFEDFAPEDEEVSYSSGDIFDDLDFRKLFYDEINNHFYWVVDQLEERDLFVLKS